MLQDNDFALKLDELVRNKGDTFSIPVLWQNEDREPLNISAAETRLYLFPSLDHDAPVHFGEKEYKVGVIDGNERGLSHFNFTPSDTQYLDGSKFDYMPVLYISAGVQYVRGKGKIIFEEFVK